jgi:hypothetical protein
VSPALVQLVTLGALALALALVGFAGGYVWGWLSIRSSVEDWQAHAQVARLCVDRALHWSGSRRVARTALPPGTWSDLETAYRELRNLDRDLAIARGAPGTYRKD